MVLSGLMALLVLWFFSIKYIHSFIFCKSSLSQPFLFLFQDSPYGFPRLFTVLLSISVSLLFSFFLFLHFFSCRFRAID